MHLAPRLHTAFLKDRFLRYIWFNCTLLVLPCCSPSSSNIESMISRISYSIWFPKNLIAHVYLRISTQHMHVALNFVENFRVLQTVHTVKSKSTSGEVVCTWRTVRKILEAQVASNPNFRVRCLESLRIASQRCIMVVQGWVSDEIKGSSGSSRLSLGVKPGPPPPNPSVMPSSVIRKCLLGWL